MENNHCDSRAAQPLAGRWHPLAACPTQLTVAKARSWKAVAQFGRVTS